MGEVKAVAKTTSLSLIRDGVENRFHLELDTTDPNRPLVVAVCSRFTPEGDPDGFVTLGRSHVTDSGQRVAMDRPGSQSGHVAILDEQGRVTEG